MDEERQRSDLISALIALSVVAVLVVWIRPILARTSDRANQSNCRGNLKNLGIGARLYLDGQGRRTRWPAASGSDFLILLYITGVASDSGSFLCPSSGDINREGADLVLGRGSGRVNATSYAGRLNASPSQEVYPGLSDTLYDLSETTMASDDGDGGDVHHGDAMLLLFADGHTELLSLTEPRRGTFGDGKNTLLSPLGN